MKITDKIIKEFKELTPQDKEAIVNMMTEYKKEYRQGK